MRTLYLSISLFFSSMLWLASVADAQSPLASQGGKGTPADNWGFVVLTYAVKPLQPGVVPTLHLSQNAESHTLRFIRQ